MATSNRASLINKAIKVIKKHFQPVEPPPSTRSLFEHLLYGCCLENSTHETADLTFESLQRDYFDWNEVRVSTIRELGEVMKPLNDPEKAAKRLKRVLQSVFESQYSFDLEVLKKQNIGQAIKQLNKYHGSTPFAVSYVTQHALLGHSIPINEGLLESMRIVGVISDAEAAKGTVPGLERAVPKSKGVEVGALLHQLGVEFYRAPFGPNIRKILLEISPDSKDRLPKRQSKKQAPPPEPEPAAKKEASAKEKRSKDRPKKKAPAAEQAKPVKKKKVVKKVVKKKAASKPAKSKTTAAPKKKVVKKKVVKKKKKVVKKSKPQTQTKRKTKTTNKRLSKRKPR